jgi:Zn-dependent protease with chaperone function
MLPSTIAQFANYKHVKKFVAKHLDMQFADINQMLMTPGFNFVAANFLCDIVSGISVSLFLPAITAPTREEALTKMRNELQYRIEWCPCSGASGDTVELQVREEGGRP